MRSAVADARGWRFDDNSAIERRITIDSQRGGVFINPGQVVQRTDRTASPVCVRSR
jgi:hypothetical protein